jgi:hypothetical protein
MPAKWSYYEADIKSLDEMDRQVQEALKNQRITEWHLRYMSWRTLNKINYNLLRIAASLETANAGDLQSQSRAAVSTEEQCTASNPLEDSNAVVLEEVSTILKMSSTDPAPVCKIRRPAETMRSPALPNARRPWNSEEDTKLRNLHSYGMTDEQIAPIFGRTIEAIARRRKVLRLVNMNRQPQAYPISITFNQGETK